MNTKNNIMHTTHFDDLSHDIFYLILSKSIEILPFLYITSKTFKKTIDIYISILIDEYVKSYSYYKILDVFVEIGNINYMTYFLNKYVNQYCIFPVYYAAKQKRFEILQLFLNLIPKYCSNKQLKNLKKSCIHTISSGNTVVLHEIIDCLQKNRPDSHEYWITFYEFALENNPNMCIEIVSSFVQDKYKILPPVFTKYIVNHFIDGALSIDNVNIMELLHFSGYLENMENKEIKIWKCQSCDMLGFFLGHLNTSLIYTSINGEIKVKGNWIIYSGFMFLESYFVWEKYLKKTQKCIDLIKIYRKLLLRRNPKYNINSIRSSLLSSDELYNVVFEDYEYIKYMIKRYENYYMDYTDDNIENNIENLRKSKNRSKKREKKRQIKYEIISLQKCQNHFL